MRSSAVLVAKSLSLAADGSDTLRQLIAQKQVHVDYLQVGPWIGTDRMLSCAANFPVLLHCNTALIDPNFNPDPLIELVSQLNPPSLSIHLSLPNTRLYSLWLRAGIPFPLFRRSTALKRAIQHLELLQATLPQLPILIENQAHHRHSGHDYLADPYFITQILTATNTNLLLDLGHARVSAAMRHETPENYIGQLPLETVIEIHISGPALYRGRLRDLHHTLSPVDYALLQSTIPRCPNLHAVTLEYFGPAQRLTDQLTNLRKILDGYSASPITRKS